MINAENHVVETFTTPFKHATIDNFFTEEAVNYINSGWFMPQTLKKVKGLTSEVQSLVKSTLPGLDQNSKHYTHDFECEVNLYHYDNDITELLRDTHADGPSKYFQCLIYLYPPGVTEVEDGDGRLELMVPKIADRVSMDGDDMWDVNKVLPYTHNRAVIWRSDYFSAHRFYSCSQGRRTVTFSFIDLDDEQDFGLQQGLNT